MWCSREHHPIPEPDNGERGDADQDSERVQDHVVDVDRA